MLTKHALLQATAAAAIVAAADTQVYNGIIAAGTPYGDADTRTSNASTLALWAEANTHPNVTQSFDFTPFYQDGVFNLGSTVPDNNNIWTLRLNVTDFSVPDARPAFPGEQEPFVDPHVTNTVFELDWHERESFRAALNGSTAPACVAVTTGSFLPNVTDLIDEDNNSGDCVPVLGEECTAAILVSGTNADCSFDSWIDIPECASTLGASRSYDEYGLSRISWDMNSNNSARNVSYEEAGYDAIANGTDGQYGFLSVSTEAYNAANMTYFERASGRMHVVVLNIAPFGGQHGLWARQALCVRADPRESDGMGSEVGEDGEAGGGSGTGAGDAGSVDDTGNAGMIVSPGMGTKGATLVLAAFWLGLVALL